MTEVRSHAAARRYEQAKWRCLRPGGPVAICDTAWEADDAAITPETTAHPIAIWAMAWRARSAARMIRHRRTLETALTRGVIGTGR